MGRTSAALGATRVGPESPRERGQPTPDLERAAWLALSSVPGIGPVNFGRLIRRHGSAVAAWQRGATLLDDLERIPPEAHDELAQRQRLGLDAYRERLEAALARLGATALLADDDGYPPALRSATPHPPVLYVVGDRAAFAGLAVAVVGTRRPTGYGRASAEVIADELARSGATVVSGLAMGIDGVAHAAAVAAGGRTVAVLPSPLDRVYPPGHRRLASHIVACGGALVTEVPPARSVGRPDFARRNRVIAGMAQATVVVEAPDRSGALLTAAATLDYGRDLFAVPGPISSAASRGCNRLIADHQAALVTSAAALLHQVGATRPEGSLSVAELSEIEGLVLGCLLKQSGSMEELIDRTLLSPHAVAAAVTLLESRALVSGYGGATLHPTAAARRIGHAGRGANIDKEHHGAKLAQR
jgi:DNA processing protein